MDARIARSALPITAAILFAARPAAAQEPSRWEEECGRLNRALGRQVVCEERETRIAARGALTVDGRENGGVSVRAHEGRDVVVRARLQAVAPTVEEARRIASQVRVNTSGETIRADGPEMDGRHWSVSYQIFVPTRTDLEVETINGPISVTGVTGEIDLRATNGPLTLRNVGGDVRARAANAPLTVALSGSRWNGEGLDAETTNGPVTLSIPEGYSAELETGTVNGPVDFDIPLRVRGRTTHVRTRLGDGGPPVRVMTTNGPLHVRRP